MGFEFLMPQKYEGQGCGLTVAVCGLDSGTQYDKIIIYIKEREENKYEVAIDSTNTFKSTKVTFNGLEERKFYHVMAEIYYEDGMRELNAKMATSVVKETSEILLFSADKKSYKGGLRPKPFSMKKDMIKGVE